LRSVAGITAIEVNISCPNVENRGQVFASNPVTARAAIEAVRRNLGGEVPIFAKLSPDVTDIAAIATEVVDAGADGLALINTILGMVIDTNTMFPKLSQKTGGLSGPAVRPVAVRAIYQVHVALPHVPIIGMGGVTTGRDAFELVLAGASAISVGTATFGNPTAAIAIKEELEALCIERGFHTFHQAIGFAHREEI
jgi:dihydroorotate dehydrogenase (NAD+) catalytic subunit